MATGHIMLRLLLVVIFATAGPPSCSVVLHPVSTIFLAYVFLGEDVTLLQLAGTGLVLIGVLAISMVKK